MLFGFQDGCVYVLAPLAVMGRQGVAQAVLAEAVAWAVGDVFQCGDQLGEGVCGGGAVPGGVGVEVGEYGEQGEYGLGEFRGRIRELGLKPSDDLPSTPMEPGPSPL